MNLLAALDQDIEIVIRKKPPSRRTARSASSRLERAGIWKGTT